MALENVSFETAFEENEGAASGWTFSCTSQTEAASFDGASIESFNQWPNALTLELAGVAAVFDASGLPYEDFDHEWDSNEFYAYGISGTSATFDSGAELAEDFEEAWSNDSYKLAYSGVGVDLTAAAFDSSPESYEDFEEAWSNDTYLTSLGSADTAIFDTVGPEAFESFEGNWTLPTSALQYVLPASIVSAAAVGTATIAKFTPANLPNVAHWYRADQGYSLDGSSKVQQWNDLIGTAHVSQGTGANRPAYNASDAAYNNKPTIQSTATSQYLAGTMTRARPFTVWIVGEFGSSGMVGVAFCASGVGKPYLGNSGGTVNMYTGTSIDTGVSANTKRAILAHCTSAPARFLGADNWSSGGTSDAGATVDGDGNFALFAFSNGLFGSLGKIAEVVIQDGTPTAGDKANMAAYLLERYGITVT